MADITSTGVDPHTLENYVTDLEVIFRSVFGADLNVDAETPQGQLIGAIALAFSVADETVVKSANSTSIFKGFGQQLDALASIINVERIGAQRSQVTVDLAGTPALLIPAGTRAATDAGDLFVLDDDVQLSGGGTASATMFSVETGAIPALAATLTNVVDVVPGWETINNVADASLGRDAEIDTTYRKSYFNRLFKNALTPVASIKAAIAGVEGVSDVEVFENDTDTPVTVQNVTIPAHTIAAIVEGGADLEIGTAIRESKTTGIPTDGTTSVDVPHPAGFDTPIEFTRVDLLAIEVDLTITINSGFPPSGLNLLKDRIVEYISGDLPTLNDELFETDGLQISETLHQFRLFTPINSVPGHTVISLALKLKPGGATVSAITPDLNGRIVVESTDDITITVT